MISLSDASRRIRLAAAAGLCLLLASACAGSSVSAGGSVNSSTAVTTVASMGLSVPPTAGGSSATPTGKASAGSTASSLAARPVALEPVTVPTKVLRSSKSGVLMLAPIMVSGKTFLFIVDTGATGSVIDATVAKSLDLPAKGPAIVSKGLACKSSAQPVSVAKWSVGGEALPAETMVATDIGFTGKKLDGVVVGGLLGADVYSVFGSVSLNFKGDTMSLGSGPSGGVPPAGQKSFPIQVKAERGVAEAIASTTIHGVPANLLVDTGSSTTEVDSQLAAKAHLQNSGSAVKVNTVGCAATAQPVAIDDLVVGSVAMPKLTGISRDNSGTASSSGRVTQGLLGADELSTFGKVTVDFKDAKVILGG